MMQFNENVCICWPNRINQSTLLSVGVDYEQTLPLENAKNRVFGKKARTVNSDSDSIINIYFDRARTLGVFAIAAHNLSAKAYWKITLYSQDDVIVYDSGTIPIWTSTLPATGLEWEDDGFWWWDGVTLDVDSETQYTPTSIHFFDKNYEVRKITILLSDSSNQDGYIEYGRLFTSEVFQPEINADWGISFSHQIESEIDSAMDGTEYIDRKTSRRTANCSFSSLRTNEAFLKMFAMQRDQGIDREILFAQTPIDNEEFYYRSFIGRVSQIDAISQPYLNKHSTTLNFIEIV